MQITFYFIFFEIFLKAIHYSNFIDLIFFNSKLATLNIGNVHFLIRKSRKEIFKKYIIHNNK